MDSAANLTPLFFGSTPPPSQPKPNPFVFGRPPSEPPHVCHKCEQPHAIGTFIGPQAQHVPPQKSSVTPPTHPKSTLFDGPPAPAQVSPLVHPLTTRVGSARILLVEKQTDATSSSISFFIRNKAGVLITDALRCQYMRPVGQCLESLRTNPEVLGYLSEYMEGELYQGWAVDDVIDTVEKDKVLVIIKKQS